MKQIRVGIFETNSSSTHSISLSNKKFIIDKLPIDNGICRIFTGEFGWEERKYSDSITKASYCLTHAQAIPLRLKDGISKLDMLRNVISKEMKCEVEFVPSNDEYYAWGYIDHQSIEDNGGPGEEVFESEEVLRNFIFNSNSILITDNDNH